MIGVDRPSTLAAMLPPKSDVPAPVTTRFAPDAVYRDIRPTRADLEARSDPEVARGHSSDAAVTTLEKLRSGEIAHPEDMGGYLYRVALNHLRNPPP